MNRSHWYFRSPSKLLLAAAALALGTNEVSAVGGGGHGGGGGHVGAYHGGYGYGHGYGYGGYGRGYYGGYGFYGYPYGYYGFGGLGLGFGLGYGYGYGYGSGYGGYNYAGYPYYGSGYGYPYYGSPASMYGAPSPAAADPYYGAVFPYGATSRPPAPGGQNPNSYGPAQQVALPGGPSGVPGRPTDSEVTLIVRVPANATVWVNGVKTTQNGPRREFTSTGLNPGRSYTYLVRAQWEESDGNAVDNDRRITVQAGERRAIDFGSAPPSAGAPTVANP